MTATATLKIGQLVKTTAGETLEIIAATADKICVADPSALRYANLPTSKWYKRTSKIVARWTVVA